MTELVLAVDGADTVDLVVKALRSAADVRRRAATKAAGVMAAAERADEVKDVRPDAVRIARALVDVNVLEDVAERLAASYLIAVRRDQLAATSTAEEEALAALDRQLGEDDPPDAPPDAAPKKAAGRKAPAKPKKAAKKATAAPPAGDRRSVATARREALAAIIAATADLDEPDDEDLDGAVPIIDAALTREEPDA